MSSRPRILIFAFALLAALPLTAQAQSTAAQVAALTEDIALLRQEVRALRLENEGLARELRTVRQQLARTQNTDTPTGPTFADLDRLLTNLKTEIQREENTTNQQLVRSFNERLQTLATQTQESLEALADALEAAPPTVDVPTFSNDFPDLGIIYTVQAGDTVSSIAQRHRARVADILNANQIADPRTLQAGQKIFVPQREGSP